MYVHSDALELDNLYHQLMDTAASRGLRAAPYDYGGPAKGGDDEDGNKVYEFFFCTFIYACNYTYVNIHIYVTITPHVYGGKGE